MLKEIAFISVLSFLTGCSSSHINFSKDNVRLVNRDILKLGKEDSNLIELDNKRGDGLAILKNIEFETGTIEIELKGEDKPQGSFVGIAFNIQNDSTYEAIYFRPFNFQSKEKIRREHSVQYIYHPEFGWKKLRTAFEGVYEAEFLNPPSPNDWFAIAIKIDSNTVEVIDRKSNITLLTVKRLEETKSKTIGLWTGFNSKGGFRKMKIKK